MTTFTKTSLPNIMVESILCILEENVALDVTEL